MYIFLIVLLVLLFGYSLMLVIANNSAITVNLIVANVAQMNLGLVLIITLVLGIAIGMLVALIVFRVFQMKFEINRLKKEKTALQVKLDEANIVIEQNRSSHTMSGTSDLSAKEPTSTL